MNKSLKIVILTLGAVAIGLFIKENASLFNTRVDAVGAVNINLGVPTDDPIFTFSNIAPGFEDSHDIVVNNGDTNARVIGIKGVKTAGMKDLENVMEVWITEGTTSIYGAGSMTGPKTLSQFFTDSTTVNGVMLTSVSANSSTTYTMHVKFQESAGNEYQEATLTFDLRFGIVTTLPVACEGMKFSKTIYGTAGDDNLKGTVGNDLIIGLEGNDRIDGGVGHDCIIGGTGANILSGGVGNDVIVGYDGNDRINGGQGKDVIYAGGGDDVIQGGEGNDTIYAGEGNDTINGGQGADTIYGEGGNDIMKGGQANDVLKGGEGIDIADGEQGKDSCNAETLKKCEVVF